MEFLCYSLDIRPNAERKEATGRVTGGRCALAIQFDDHVLDPVRRELSERCFGEDRTQSLRPADHLIENRHRVVSKDDLIAQVWGGPDRSDSASPMPSMQRATRLGTTGRRSG